MGEGGRDRERESIESIESIERERESIESIERERVSRERERERESIESIERERERGRLSVKRLLRVLTMALRGI